MTSHPILFQLSLAVTLALIVTGCGLIFGDRTQSIVVSTWPAGVEVSAKGRKSSAPVTLTLTKRREDRSPFVVRGTKAGYYDACQILEFDSDGLFVTLDSIPVAIGLAIDAMADTWPGNYPDQVYLELLPKPEGYIDLLPSDEEILRIRQESSVDLCNPSAKLREWMDLRSRYTEKAKTVIVASGEISRPYRILGRVDADAKGIDRVVWSYWQVGGFGSFNVTRTQHKENPVAMNELLTYEALKKYGDSVDAIINVHYETQPGLDVFAGGIAVHFDDSARYSAPLPDPGTASTSEERLRQLQKLRDQKLISPQEYEEKRRKIVDSL